MEDDLKPKKENRNINQWQLNISIISLLLTLLITDPVGRLIELGIVSKTGNQYSFPFIVEHYEMMLLINTTFFLIVITFVILFTRYGEDTSYDNFLFRCAPIIFISLFITIMILMFQSPVSAIEFLLLISVSFVVLLAIKWFLNFFIKFICD